MPSYRLTPAAKKDLTGIWCYTCKTWSARQADHYIDAIKEGCEKITEKKVLWKSFPEIHPHLYSLRCEHHYLFFLYTENEKPIVIAVLHERMKMLARLEKRLIE